MTWILGVNTPPTGWHDTAACLIDGDGRVVAMSEEERFTRRKHGLHQAPINAVRFCLAEAGIGPADVDAVAVGWDAPRMHLEHDMGWGWTSPDRLLAELGLDRRHGPEVVFVPHHRAHAVSAWWAAGCGDAAIVVADGNGEDESVTLWEARAGQPLVRRRRWPRAGSLGLMYSAVSEVLGFGLLGAGQTMGLASYGRAAGVEPWPMLDADLTPPFAATDETGYEDVMIAWRKHLALLLDRPIGEDTYTLDRDPTAIRLAWSAQAAVELAMPRLVADARRITGLDDVCLAGGVALNCSVNGQLPPPVHAPPVPHDAGVALGAAWSLVTADRPGRPLDPYLGRRLDPSGLTGTDPLRIPRVVELLRGGAIGAIATGRSEAGPRALGHRSIIAMPSTTAVRDTINQRKGREPWRPLAPVARTTDAERFWTVRPHLQRYMLGATEATEYAADTMPGAVHVDGTVRAQVVDDGPLSDILAGLAADGLPPVLINTSLNTRGEPLVDTAAEALAAYDAIGLDFLILGDRMVERVITPRRVLVTNDDGPASAGLAALVAAAIGTGTRTDDLLAAARGRATPDIVLVAVPDRDRSSTGTSLGHLFTAPVTVQPASVGGVDGLLVAADPAAVVTLAATGAFGPPPDAVLVGVNRGHNIGRGVIHSSTVGAALTAAAHGIPAVAVSAPDTTDCSGWAPTLERIAAAVRGPWPAHGVLSVNLSAVASPSAEPAFRWAEPADATADATITRGTAGDLNHGAFTARLVYRPRPAGLEGTDMAVLSRGQNALTWLNLPYAAPPPPTWRAELLARVTGARVVPVAS